MNFRCLVFLALAFCIGPSLAQPASPQQQVSVEFSLVPPAGKGSESRGNIKGRVLGLESPQKYKIVLYAHTDRWYVQPLESDHYTDLDAGGNWANWTHLGDMYAAVVVRPSFEPDPRPLALPPVGGDVIARGQVPASGK